MTTTTKATTAATKKRAALELEKEAKKRAEAVKKILANVESKMTGETVKLTLGDYIRLIQLSREMEEQPTEMKVGWVEEPEYLDET
jgi:hypothetical protein